MWNTSNWVVNIVNADVPLALTGGGKINEALLCIVISNKWGSLRFTYLKRWHSHQLFNDQMAVSSMAYSRC